MRLIRNKWLRVLATIFALASILTISACSSKANAQDVSSDSAQLAPDFALQDLNGKSVALSDFRGKPVLFNYWASWCPSCVKEMPIIQSAYVDWSKRGLMLLTVNAGEDLQTVQDFLKKNQYTFPVLLDSQGDAGDKYNVYAIPISVFVDKHGRLVKQVIGPFSDRAALDRQITALMNLQ